MTAEISARRGADWFAKSDGALQRLVRFMLAARRDPGMAARLADAEREQLTDKSFGWLALYGARFPDRVADQADLAKGRYWITGAAGI